MPPRRSGLNPRLALLVAACLSFRCATRATVVSSAARQRVAAATDYQARLRIWLKAPALRARGSVLVAFERPDAMRLEVPGPSGARLIAVTRSGALTAVFPGERAVHTGLATAEVFERLLGVALAPEEVMDLLLGSPPSRVRARLRWGAVFPREIRATLPDSTQLKLIIDDAQIDRPLPASAFAAPPHDGFRMISADEARALWADR